MKESLKGITNYINANITPLHLDQIHNGPFIQLCTAIWSYDVSRSEKSGVWQYYQSKKEKNMGFYDPSDSNKPLYQYVQTKQMKTDLKFTEVGGHTFCPELLSDGVIIDVGCRGFVFSAAFPGKEVFCVDPDPKVFEDEWAKRCMSGNYWHLECAIADKKGEAAYYENGEATCLKQIDPDQSHPFIPCQTITMDDLYEITGTNVDVLKLDCEGAEYIILGETFKPIPKQLSIEWHNHTVPEMHERCYPAIKERLLKDYVMFNEVCEKRHGCPENVWDVLFIRKDLL